MANNYALIMLLIKLKSKLKSKMRRLRMLPCKNSKIRSEIFRKIELTCFSIFLIGRRSSQRVVLIARVVIRCSVLPSTPNFFHPLVARLIASVCSRVCSA